MWVPMVVEGLKVILVWAVLELVYGGESSLDPSWYYEGCVAPE
jgi:hypothetical protein